MIRPFLRAALLALPAYTLLSTAAPAQPAATCPRLGPFTVDLQVPAPDVVITPPAASLNAHAAGVLTPFAHPEILALTRADLRHVWRLDLSVIPSSDPSQVCLQPRLLTIELGYPQAEITLRTDVAAHPCKREATLGHERDHIAAATASLRLVSGKIREAVTSEAQGVAARPYPTEDIARADLGQRIEAAIGRWVGQALRNAEQDHRNLDRHDALIALSAACGTAPSGSNRCGGDQSVGCQAGATPLSSAATPIGHYASSEITTPSPPLSLPPMAAHFLAPGGSSALGKGLTEGDLLEEMLGLASTRRHDDALRAFNLAATDASRREAVAEFYGFRTAAAAEEALGRSITSHQAK